MKRFLRVEAPSFTASPRSEFSLDPPAELPSVEIVYSYANLGRDTIDFLVRRDGKGIVLARKDM